MALVDTYCQGKPDLDNVQKSVLDALNGVAYLDDKQCCAITAQKYNSIQGRIDIRLTRLSAEELHEHRRQIIAHNALEWMNRQFGEED